jgi:hypothetical protein
MSWAGYDHNLNGIVNNQFLQWSDADIAIVPATGFGGAPVTGVPSYLFELLDVDTDMVPDVDDVLTWDGLEWTSAPVSGGGGGSGVDVEDEGTPVATATTLNFTGAGVTATDAGGGQVDVDVPGGGGGGSVPIWVETLLAPDDSPDEAQEFAPGSPGGTLIEPTGTSTWTQARDVLSVSFDGQSTADLSARMYALSGTWQAGSYIEAAIRAVTKFANFCMFGIVVTDDGGDGLADTDPTVYGHIQHGATTPTAAVRRGTFTAAGAATVSSTMHLSPAPVLYHRLTMVSSGTWRGEWSPDGVSWTTLAIADLTSGITDVTHYGFGVSAWGGGIADRIATCEYLRVYNLV